MRPQFSENNNFTESFSFKADKSIFAEILMLGKHISNKLVIKPPDAISWPAMIKSFFIKS